MPNPQKEATIKDLTERFSNARSIYFTNYTGLNVELMNKLRKELRAGNVEYKIVKNTLSRIAAKNAGLESLDSYLSGPVGLALSYDNPALPAKLLSDFVKKNKLETLDISGCVFDKEVFDAGKVKTIITLPPKDTLMAQFLGTLQAPLSDLVGVLNAALGNLVGVLKSLSEEKNQ